MHNGTPDSTDEDIGNTPEPNEEQPNALESVPPENPDKYELTELNRKVDSVLEALNIVSKAIAQGMQRQCSSIDDTNTTRPESAKPRDIYSLNI